MKSSGDGTRAANSDEIAAEHGVTTNARVIGPEQARPAGELPTLAERIARGEFTYPSALHRSRRPAGPTPRFVDEEGHILEPVGYMGKLSKVTPAKRAEPEAPFEPPSRHPTLAERIRGEGLAAQCKTKRRPDRSKA